MTNTVASPATSSGRAAPGGAVLGWAAAAGTLPYLVLKVLWLTGHPVGVIDRVLLADPAITALNLVTAVLDAVVIALAFALTSAWGRRLPAWSVLLPMWVGTGFLVPMAVAVLPATAATLLSDGAAAGPLAPWVQPMVYAGFAWQGVFLTIAFAVHARSRWAAVVSTPGVASPAVAPLLGVLTTGGAAMAVLSAGLQLAVGVLAGTVTALAVQTVLAGLALSGAAGVAALVRGAAGHRWAAATAAWTGSAAMFSWGLWAAVTTMGATPLGGGPALAGLAQLTGLLGGFALAVAGLLALAGIGVARPAR